MTLATLAAPVSYCTIIQFCSSPQELYGNRGLLFTNTHCDEVLEWFTSYSEEDYARSGCAAMQDVMLEEGICEHLVDRN